MELFNSSGLVLRASCEAQVLGAENPAQLMEGPAASTGPTRPAELPGLGGGEVRSLSLPNDVGLQCEWEIFRPRGDASRLAVRMVIRNGSGADVRMASLTPLRVTREGLSLAGKPAGQWVYWRQPRHKNDLPATLRLDSTWLDLADAVKGMPESGGLPAGSIKDDPPRQFVSSEVVLLTCDGEGLLAGAVPADRQLVQSVLRLAPDRRSLESFRVDCQCDGQVLPAGARLESQWIVLLSRRDPLAALDEYAELLASWHAAAAAPSRRPVSASPPAGDGSLPPHRRVPPTVWCSWYYYGDGFNQDELEDNLRVLNDSRLPVDVVLIDECWDSRWGDWWPNSRWRDLSAAAARIRQAGRVPGIWTCPLLAEPRSTLRQQHGDWLLRNRCGQFVRFGMNSMTNYVLDPTHPGVLEFVEDLYRRLTRQWGFLYHKLDFTRAAVMDAEPAFHDPTKSRAEAYRLAMSAVRQGAGDEAYISLCGGLYSPSVGIADSHRAGSDTSGRWPAPPAEQAGEPFGPLTIKQNALRAWWNRLWDNDPDAAALRRRRELWRFEELSLGLFNDEEARTVALNQYLGGGIVCFSENLAEVEIDRLELLRHCAPSLGVAAWPRGAVDGRRFCDLFHTHVLPLAEEMHPWQTLSVINWLDRPQALTVTLDEASLGAFAHQAKLWAVTSFRGGWTRILQTGENLRTDPLPPHACDVLKVQGLDGPGPRLLHANGHFSMGGAEIRRWRPCPDRLEILVHWPWASELELELSAPSGRSFARLAGGSTAAPLGPQGLQTMRLRIPQTPSGGLRVELPYEKP